MISSVSFKTQLLIFTLVILAITLASVTSIWFTFHTGFPTSSDRWLVFLNLWFGFILGPLGGIYLPIYSSGTSAIGGFTLSLTILGMALSFVPLRIFIKNKNNEPTLLLVSAIFWCLVPFICVTIIST